MKSSSDDRLFYYIFKRGFDLLISTSGLIILSPFMLLICLLIVIDDGTPVIYKAGRVGKYGRIFKMFKFRTMIRNAEKAGPSSASSSDSRITKTGRFLRKYKLDELPQLLNVFTGQMSIIGPRPEEKKFTDLFNEEERMILSVKPGITDWASLLNSNEGEILEGSEDPDQTYMELIRPGKIELQLKYVRNSNFLVDLKILFLTLRKLIFRGIRM
jgi:lipopolysaccharide/colanic/teichoic acid biosynthesis glycosyltransferase